MPKKLPADTNKRAFEIVAALTAEPQTEAETISRVMRSMGRKGGLKGGAARAAKLTPEERKSIAAKAAAARWRKKD